MLWENLAKVTPNLRKGYGSLSPCFEVLRILLEQMDRKWMASWLRRVRHRAQDEPVEKLIIGLGNPGRQYAHNRHNVGFQCLDRLAQAHGLSFSKRQAKASLASGKIADVRVVLAKPRTYMNLSGQAVGPLVRFYKLPLEDILVIHDDLDLPLGTIRLRPAGGSGGHKGMRSIIEVLGSQTFPRLRVGIGRPPGNDAVSYVLNDFTADERITLESVYEKAVAAVELFLREGIEAAMNTHN